MPLTALRTLVTALVLTVLAAVTVAATWNLGRRRVRRVAIRSVSIVALLATTLLATGIYVNRQAGFFDSWSQLTQPATSSAGSLWTPSLYSARYGDADRLVDVRIPGPRAGFGGNAVVVLPAQYDEVGWQHARFPVIELLGGFPSTPNVWVHAMHVAQVMADEVDQHRLPPAIAVIPSETPSFTRDTECVNAALGHGLRADTYLSQDVPGWVEAHFRAIRTAPGWAIMGISTGGYCAVNLTLRHPGRFGMAVSIEGYLKTIVDHTTGDLFGKDVRVRDANDDLWRLRHLPVPRVPVLLTAARGDAYTTRSIRALLAIADDPLRVSILATHGAHNYQTFRSQEPFALTWIGSHLAPVSGLPLLPKTGSIYDAGGGSAGAPSARVQTLRTFLASSRVRAADRFVPRERRVDRRRVVHHRALCREARDHRCVARHRAQRLRRRSAGRRRRAASRPTGRHS